MDIHRHLTVSDRQLGILVKRKIVLVYLVAGSADDFNGSVAVNTLLHRTYRLYGRRAARVTGTIVTVYRTKCAFAQLALQQATVREVLVLEALTITKSMSHHDTAAVNALPKTYRERILLTAGIEGIVPPPEFLRGKADKPAMACKSWQVIAEAEAVGKEHIGALLAKLLAIECLAKQYIANPRLS